MSLETDIADGVLAEIEAGSYSAAFDPVRAWMPVFDLEELETLRVTVVPFELDIEPFTRTSSSHELTVSVCVQQAVESDDVAAIDALVAIGEQLRDQLAGKDQSPGEFQSIAQRPIVDPARLRVGEFFGVVQARYLAFR